MDRIIIRIQILHKEILRHLSKYVDFYNSFFAFRKQYSLFLENTEDGVIFLYKDWETYLGIVKNEDLKKIKPKTPRPHYREPFLLQMFYPPEKFPADGVIVTFQIINGPFDEIFALSRNYFHRFDPSIEFTSATDRTPPFFTMHVKSYAAIEKYTHFLIDTYITPQNTNPV